MWSWKQINVQSFYKVRALELNTDINYIPEKSNNSILGNGCVKPIKKSQFEKSYKSEGNLYLAPPTFQKVFIIISRYNISQHIRKNFNLEHLQADDRMVEF